MPNSDCKDTIHPASEFANFPWNTISPERPGDWSFGRGGHGFGEDSWSISIFRDNGGFGIDADIWELPPHFGYIFQAIKKCEKRRTTDNIRHGISHLLDLLGLKFSDYIEEK